MGTEVFPIIYRAIQGIVGIIIVLSFIVIAVRTWEWRKAKGNVTKQHEARGQIMNALNTILLALIALLFVSAIGPALNILF